MAGQKVPFASENVRGCICMQCPVQSKSLCAKEKERLWKEGGISTEGVRRHLRATVPPSIGLKPQDTPRLYCSSGKAICKDIDTRQMCICGVCPVWNKFKLAGAKPPMYFCRDGTAR